MPKKGDQTDVIDRQKRVTIDDFRKLSEINKEHAEGEPEITAKAGDLSAPPIPDVAQVLAAPHPPKVANTKLVTLAVTDDVPLRDVLFELGRLASVDIEVGAGLDTTGINLRATDRPFNEVIERIATLGHLRYSVNGNSIRVERDLPYIKNYSLDFLNLVRSSKMGYTLNTNVISGGGGSGGLGGGSSSGSSGGSGGGSSDTGGGVGTSGSTASIDASAPSDLWTSLEASVNEIVSFKADGDSAGAASQAAQGAAGTTTSNVIINRQAGVLSVNATERQHEMIQKYLSLMSRNASAQVLIEAKIVEVSLADQFASGVDWNRVIGDVTKHAHIGVGRYLATNPATGSAITTAGLSNPAFTFGIEDGDLGAILAMTQTFGTTRTLSSPRLSAINNQQAVLTFARNAVYFDCTFTPATQTNTGNAGGGTSTQAALSCTQKTVPIGIVLNILPSVNLDSQEVTLSVRPTLTRQVGSAVNPATGFLRSIATDAAAAALIPDIAIPIIEVREIDSITKVKSGGVMVIGGLMEDASRNTDTGVPGVNEIPLFGNLFKSRSEDALKRELIIFVKATIVNSDGSAQKVDEKVYKKFVTDPRPLFTKP